GKVVLYQLSYFRISEGAFSQTRCKDTAFSLNSKHSSKKNHFFTAFSCKIALREPFYIVSLRPPRPPEAWAERLKQAYAHARIYK
ncbi:MAG: hypothetical protein SPI56_03840, partial [Alloprevotella sp.]|nr:hypothetical protein [Alloprevotella sp.]